MNFKNNIKNILSYEISNFQEKQFEKYFNKLIEYNQKVNLTAITEKLDVYYKHFFDSISSLSVLDFSKKDLYLCDIGSGAGFPSIPLKILFPNLKIDIVDSLNKRIMFLKELTSELELNDIHLFHDRIEKYALSNQDKYDIVTARALGKLNLISEMSIPMLKVEGLFVAYKGSEIEGELKGVENALTILGSKIKTIKKLELPFDFGERNIILIIKNKKIKGYPRTYSAMKNKPL